MKGDIDSSPRCLFLFNWWTKVTSQNAKAYNIQDSQAVSDPSTQLGRVVFGRVSFAFVQKFPVVHTMDKLQTTQRKVKGKVLVLEFSQPNANGHFMKSLVLINLQQAAINLRHFQVG
uniref:Uncharacterized protein n=1 Tax=Caenorhabditis japonica TaxID=281687 RepID=A0A8R1IH73_CAEJA